MMAFTSLMRTCNWGTEYSALERMDRRSVPFTMKWCWPPTNGPSKPSRGKRRMKSRRLEGVHRSTGYRGVEVDVVDESKWMAELELEHDPLIERGAQRGFRGQRGWTDLPQQWSVLFAVSSPGSSGRPRSFVRITFDASGEIGRAHV